MRSVGVLRALLSRAGRQAGGQAGVRPGSASTIFTPVPVCVRDVVYVY